MRARTMVTLLALLAWSVAGRADEWDSASEGDDGTFTDNTLFHGSRQQHDLGTHVGFVADQDWYLMAMRPFSSYEVIVDGQTGDLILGANQLQRMDANGVLAQTGSVSEDPGTVKLKWRTGPAGASVANFVRVHSPGCGTACDLIDTYRIRFYETTYTVPRFNNSGTQSTVLVVQNATSQACEVMSAYFSGAGALLTTQVDTLAAAATFVRPTAGLAPLAGQSGSIRLLHTCGYDGLSGKAVAIEPATGFTFDTEIVSRPR
ncbi:MAG: hypothetical protein ABW221_15555 [Vicinamibacteria bacterium]